jgi:pyrroloquinoline quinone biosynthesis protein D
MSAQSLAARVPRFKPGVKFRMDTVRNAWVVLGPERLFLPDEQAVEVLKLIDGARSLGEIARELAARYMAPDTVVFNDVETMLADLGEKGVITW